MYPLSYFSSFYLHLHMLVFLIRSKKKLGFFKKFAIQEPLKKASTLLNLESIISY